MEIERVEYQDRLGIMLAMAHHRAGAHGEIIDLEV